MRITAGKIIVIAAILGGGYWYYTTHNATEAKKGPATTIVTTAPVALKDIAIDLHDVGNVAAYETVGIKSRLDSQIMEVKFKDGDEVHKGDLLFQLDDRALKAQEKELLANVARDKAQAENLRLQFERAQALTAKGYVSASNLDTAKAAYLAQQATVAATQASLDNVNVQIAYCRITAPISGRTGTITVTTGNTVKGNDTGTLVTINQIKPIRVKISLAQNYFPLVRDAMQQGKVAVTATREGSGKVSSGVLEYVDNEVDQTTGTFVVRAVFDNEDEALWPGMFVNTSLILGTQKGAITIPEVAVQHGQNGDYVFVITDGKASKRDIKTDRMQDELAVITSGLKEGEVVAIDGLMSLKDGGAVTESAKKEAPQKTDDTKPEAPAENK